MRWSAPVLLPVVLVGAVACLSAARIGGEQPETVDPGPGDTRPEPVAVVDTACKAKCTPERGWSWNDQEGCLPAGGLPPDAAKVREGLWAWESCLDGRRILQGEGLTGKAAPTFTLSTYDERQTFDADKNFRARMRIEVRWSDESKAKSGLKPGTRIEFATAFGTFPDNGLEPTEISTLRPDENDRGYRFWFITVEQAAKNESGNPILYSIKADAGPGDAEVVVRDRINYVPYNP